MRLAEYIAENIEPILEVWEDFARSIWPVELSDPETDPATLRDHAEDILRAIAAEMVAVQSGQHRLHKSMGYGPVTSLSLRLDRASIEHGTGRVVSGFELWAVIAEYRALRASVIRLWRAAGPPSDERDLDDLTRFHEAMDQSLTEGVRSYTEQVRQDREELLRKEEGARQEAEYANRAKDMFLATLSHEMRTPLNAIVGWLSILRMDDFSQENFSEALDVIERNTKIQLDLMDDVLDVSRIVSGKLRLEIVDCDLHEVIEAGVEVVRPAVEARSLVLDIQLDPQARRATCDPARIQQVVWNLLMNAAKFSPEGGTVCLSLVRESSAFRLVVKDSGRGIRAEFLPFVFDRFRQADDSARRRYGGLGLGLSIVKHLTEMHGGSVEVDSPGEGQGATFTVRLPIRAAVEADCQAAAMGHTAELDVQSAPTRLDGLHVLIVDDEPDARRMLARVLEGVGARVSTASSAAEALTALEAVDRSDVLVSDIGMPEQSGYDLIREVRRRGNALPAVALTAYVRALDAQEAMEAGFQLHLGKPVNVRELTEAIASLAPQSSLRPGAQPPRRDSEK